MLRLEKNSITRLQNFQFVQTPNLQELYLAENKIEKINDFSFETLNNVQIIDLSYNRLTSLKIHILDQL